MKIRIFNSFLLLALSLIYSASVSAQTIKSYNLGEVLTYEAKFSKMVLRGIPAADLSFTVANAPDGQNYLIKSEAKSKGTLIKLVNKDFFQQYESIVDAKSLDVLKTDKRDVQDNRVRDSRAEFDYKNKQVTYVETDPKDAMRPPRTVASQIETGTQDLITGIYTLRRLPLEVGKTFELTISDSGLVYKIPVRVTAREQQKSVLGRIWCFRVEPEIFGANRLIEQKGSLILWITDDARRIPVRTQINADIGRVEVKLKTVSYAPKTASATK